MADSGIAAALCCVIYVRISRDREGAGLGVARQEEDCRELAARLGLTVLAVLSDNDISAYSGKPRPGYRQLLAMISAGEIGTVLAWHTDRLHRQPAELEEYITACDRHGVTTATVKAGELDLATPSGQMAARMFGAVARYHVDHMREQARRARLQGARNGKWSGGPRRFGYQADGITPEPGEAALILEASRAVLAGVSIKAIAREWHAAGVQGAMGGDLTSGQIARILRRPRNGGLREHHGQVVGTAEWPAIVPEHIWRAVAMRLNSPSRRLGPGPERRYLGSGLYTCGICGGVLHARRGTQTASGSRRVYWCGRGPGPHVTRSTEILDEYVTSVLLEWAEGWAAKRDFTSPPPPAAPDTSGLHALLDAARERLDEAARMYQAGTIDGRQLAEITAAQRQQSTALEARIAAAASISPLTALEGTGDLREKWDALGLARQRAVVDFVVTVVVHPAPRGRPAGWRPGTSYFHAESIEFRWKAI